jgi:hypothetical protein
MGSQSRSSLSHTGPGYAHFPPLQIKQVKEAVNLPADEAGQKVSAKVLISVLAQSNPFFATILSVVSLLVIIQKVIHYAEIAERDGTDAAVLAILKDIADGAIREYVTDSVMDSLIDSGSISPELRDQIETLIGAVVDQGIDQMEEAFLNE